jgi:hypothetical protein
VPLHEVEHQCEAPQPSTTTFIHPYHLSHLLLKKLQLCCKKRFIFNHKL